MTNISTLAKCRQEWASTVECGPKLLSFRPSSIVFFLGSCIYGFWTKKEMSLIWAWRWNT